MTTAEDVWSGRTDEQLLEAAACLDEYTADGRQTILREAERRGLNVSPLVEAVGRFQTESQDGPSPRCAFCDTYILFGGKREGAFRFCNDQCRSEGILLAVSHRLADGTVAGELWKLHQGECPECGGPGPVDVHTSHRVWSAIVMTSWGSRPQISCRRCGTRAQIREGVLSLLLGWWALPWGPIITPVQVFRNVSGALRTIDTARPSATLERLVRLRLAAGVVAGPTPASNR